MEKFQLSYLLVLFPIVFMSLYYKDIVDFTESIDPTVHPDYLVRCSAEGASVQERFLEVVEVNGTLYCCDIPPVECSDDIVSASIETVNGVTMCTVEEEHTNESDVFNTTEIHKPTPVSRLTSKAKSETWLYAAASSIGFVGILAFATNRKNVLLKSFNIATFIAEVVVGTLILQSETESAIISGPYLGLGGTGSGQEGLTKWYGLLLILSVTSEWVCDAMIMSASVAMHLAGNFNGNTLEADGWEDPSPVAKFFIGLTVLFQCGCGGAYMVSAAFSCGSDGSIGVVAVWTAFPLSLLGCCAFIWCSMGGFCTGGAKFARLAVSLLITEIPGLIMNPETDGLGRLFLVLLGYSTFELVLDVSNMCGWDFPYCDSPDVNSGRVDGDGASTGKDKTERENTSNGLSET